MLSEPFSDTSLTDFAKLFTLVELCRTDDNNHKLEQVLLQLG